MSLPKEPRQLMINIMYLVLTALLALNVSAEIFNAFAMVDKGLEASNDALDEANDKLPEAIKTAAKKKKELQKYADRVDLVRETSEEFYTYIQGMKNTLIDMGGDINGTVDDADYVITEDSKKLRGLKNYDITTRYMVGVDNKEGEGETLKAKLQEYKTKFLSFVDDEDRASFESKIPIVIDDATWQRGDHKKKNWSDFNFGHMPLGSVLPILTKFQNDTKASESAVLNYLNGKVGGKELVLDQFKVVSSPKKTYVIKGEKFETEVFLSASASQESNAGIAISVNGRAMNIGTDGVAKYSAIASTTGKKTYNVKAAVTNPTTGETDEYTSRYEYEVGERSVAISASKMNVFYIGVPNPVEISAAGVNSTKINVSMSGGGGGKISKNADGTYTVTVTKPALREPFAKINVSADGMSVGKDFRVKRIPDPIPMLGKKRGGKISAGELKIQQGVIPKLVSFDFEAKCNISGFRIVRVAKRSDPIIKANKGGRFGPDVKAVIAKAKPGDKFYFEEIKCKCPGDSFGRDLGTMSFTIK